MPPSVCPDFELDGSANLGSIFLQGMLSEKEFAGFSNNYGPPTQPDIVGDVDETPTEDDWKNL
jgi:hypothetical protein